MNERLLNNMVLRYFNDLRGIPRTIEEVHDYIQQRWRKPCLPAVERAIEYLSSALYLARCEAMAADEPLYVISASGIRQILKQVKPDGLDPMIHGS